jgi:N-acetylmuramoyl-L-alanine amidase
MKLTKRGLSLSFILILLLAPGPVLFSQARSANGLQQQPDISSPSLITSLDSPDETPEDSFFDEFEDTPRTAAASPNGLQQGEPSGLGFPQGTISPNGLQQAKSDKSGIPGASPGVPPGASPGEARWENESSFGLDEVLKALGSSPALRWDPFFSTGVFSAGGHYAAFNAALRGDKSTVILDSLEILNLPAPYLENGALRFPESFVSALKRAFDNRVQDEQNRFRIAAIVVDPGHGGKDPGAKGTLVINGKTVEILEKDITLKASKQIYDRLRLAYPDKRVLLTRTGDTYPTLDDRVLLANSIPLKENEAVLYISIHANASVAKNARGYEVWYLSPNYRRELIDKTSSKEKAEIIPLLNDMLQEEFTTESIMIAQAIDRRIGEAMGRSIPSRGLKAEEWFVVKNARMPSVLVELGFITNEADARILTGEEGLKNLTEAIYKGIRDFVNIFEDSGGFTINQ